MEALPPNGCPELLTTQELPFLLLQIMDSCGPSLSPKKDFVMDDVNVVIDEGPSVSGGGVPWLEVAPSHLFIVGAELRRVEIEGQGCTLGDVELHVHKPEIMNKSFDNNAPRDGMNDDELRVDTKTELTREMADRARIVVNLSIGMVP